MPYSSISGVGSFYLNSVTSEKSLSPISQEEYGLDFGPKTLLSNMRQVFEMV